MNTFDDLESYVVQSFMSDNKTPTVYPVGPILNQNNQTFDDYDDEVKKWLDDQPENSVLYLCFGTMGSFDETQVMPEGFLERITSIGKVIGWAPQEAVLAHPAVGGFVSHCGWNPILESVWFGVPIATFPLYAEQQLNAFYLVKEIGVAEMIRLDYNIDFSGKRVSEIVGAEEIEAAIRRLMAEKGVRGKLKEMQKKARAALEEGGSSYKAHNLFIEDVIRNVA
ncbi:hypothetical protein C2S52_012165 [Perilla frutescens var. hirtella]|nr:hypothetical protein C2S52_012165 [Perilla frutescens var. hirtella]